MLFRKVINKDGWKFKYRLIKPVDIIECEDIDEERNVRNKLKSRGFKFVGSTWFDDFGIIFNSIFYHEELQSIVYVIRELGE